jgi:thioredoxin-related protein
MKIRLVHQSITTAILLILAALVPASAQTSRPPQPPEPKDSFTWFDVEKGFALARKENKPVFLWFYGDGCGYCKKMRTIVYPDTAIVSRMKDFVPIRVESSSTRKISYDGATFTEADFAVQKFNVRKIPSTWFVEPSGCRILHLKGYRTVKDLVEHLDFVRNKQYGDCPNYPLVDPPPTPKAPVDSSEGCPPDSAGK